MAIKPSSDIVFDVLKAADPAGVAAATARLTAISNARSAASGGFGEAVDQAAKIMRMSSTRVPHLVTAKSGDVDRASSAQTGLEALLLGNFVKEMLPKDASTVFGYGLAGDMWKSMLADQMAKQIAESGALAIGKRLFATHALPSGVHNHFPAQKGTQSAAAAQASANAISMPSAAELAHGGVLFAGRQKS